MQIDGEIKCVVTVWRAFGRLRKGHDVHEVCRRGGVQSERENE